MALGTLLSSQDNSFAKSKKHKEQWNSSLEDEETVNSINETLDENEIYDMEKLPKSKRKEKRKDDHKSRRSKEAFDKDIDTNLTKKKYDKLRAKETENEITSVDSELETHHKQKKKRHIKVEETDSTDPNITEKSLVCEKSDKKIKRAHQSVADLITLSDSETMDTTNKSSRLDDFEGEKVNRVKKKKKMNLTRAKETENETTSVDSELEAHHKRKKKRHFKVEETDSTDPDITEKSPVCKKSDKKIKRAHQSVTDLITLSDSETMDTTNKSSRLNDSEDFEGEKVHRVKKKKKGNITSDVQHENLMGATTKSSRSSGSEDFVPQESLIDLEKLEFTDNTIPDNSNDSASYSQPLNVEKNSHRVLAYDSEIEDSDQIILCDGSDIPDVHMLPEPMRRQIPLRKIKEYRGRGIKLKTGKFSAEEIKILKNNVKKFRKAHDLSKKMIAKLLGINAKTRSKEKRNFYKKFGDDRNFLLNISKGLNLRSIFSVYSIARKLFDINRKNLKNGQRLTKEQDEKLLRLYSLKGPNYSEISTIMKIPAYKLLQRMRTLNQTNVHKGLWSTEENKMIKAAIAKVLKVDENHIYHFFEGIPWEEVASLVPNRTAMQCRMHWTKSAIWKLEKEEKQIPFITNDYLVLLDLIRKSGVEHEEEIDWGSIAYEFSRSVSYSEIRAKWRDMKALISSDDYFNLEEMLSQLEDYYSKIIENDSESEEIKC